jgi:methyltransferase (TIGR00027 family)
MEARKPSESAIAAAMIRASHLILDDNPKILQDTLAWKFSGAANKKAVITSLDSFYNGMAREMSPEFAHAFSVSGRAYSVIRQRYAEDELGKALGHGVSQYVILGAGLDSFAFRQPDLEKKLRVFEVDHTDTQDWKKRRLSELGIAIPRNLVFVPLDFETQLLSEELRLAGCKLDFQAYFSLLGVAHYISQAALFQTLNEIVHMAPGSEIVFDYALVDSLLDERERQGVVWIKSQKRQQPAQSQFDPAILKAKLEDLGFIVVEDFGSEDAYTRYLNGRTDELSPNTLNKLSYSVLRAYRFIKARVRGK